MSVDPSPSDFERWEALLEQGAEPSTAAKQLGFTCSRFRRANTERHAAALTLAREARGYFVDEEVEKLALVDDPSPFTVKLWAQRHNPAYRERQELQVSGPDGGVVEVRVVHDEEHATGLARKLAGLGLIPAGAAGSDPSEPAAVDPAPAA